MITARKRSARKDLKKQITIDLLEKQYSTLRKETLLQVQSIKNHVRNSFIVVAGLISVVAFLLNAPNYALSAKTASLWLLLMLLGSTVTFYLFFAVMESVFA